MTVELTPDPEGPEEPRPMVSSALSKATASNPREASVQMGISLVLFLGLVGLILWGVASCTGATFKAVGEGFEKVMAEGEAGPTADANPSDGGYSDTVVIAGAKSAVLRKLVDDRSARFRSVGVVVQSSGTKAVCGEVNSKSRAGGYAGYQRFLSAGTDEFTWLEEQVPDFADAWNQICVR